MKNQLRKHDRSGNLFPSFFNRYWNDDFFSNFVEGDLPAVNVSENDKSFDIELSIPGFNKEDINIEVDKNVLKISAQKEQKNEERDENKKILRQEFRSSSFSRSFILPEEIKTEEIEASQKDGILHISLPKSNEAIENKIKKIEIK